MKRILEIAISVVMAAALCFLLQFLYLMDIMRLQEFLPSFVPVLVGVLFGIIFYFTLAKKFTESLMQSMATLEDRLVKMSLRELLISVLGCFIGLVLANLIGLAIRGYGVVGTSIVILLNVVLGTIGFRVAQQKKDELPVPSTSPVVRNMDWGNKKVAGRPKILDTSVIIDGRILDILHTGFIEGKIIIPDFVLVELRHIADSADDQKRKRGRRGLDILNDIQQQLSVPVEIMEFATKEQLEVDSKLLKMAAKMDACVVTNDYNLNKVAAFQGVQVLNINELANAVKSVVLPGEEMQVNILKEGKENGQGVAYLNDGTMIVVEGGNRHIGETLEVVVTSALQTAAGRMIFCKIKEVNEKRA